MPDEGGKADVSRPVEQPVDTFSTPTSGVFGITTGLERALVAQASMQVVQWQGHYPPPDAAERFEKLAPGAFERMLAMAERAQASQLASVADVNRNIGADARRGAVLGTTVTLASMLGAGVCAWLNQPWVAAAFLGVPVLSVARSLIETSRRK